MSNFAKASTRTPTVPSRAIIKLYQLVSLQTTLLLCCVCFRMWKLHRGGAQQSNIPRRTQQMLFTTGGSLNWLTTPLVQQGRLKMVKYRVRSKVADRKIREVSLILDTTKMWADAQRDGHPAEYRWCPLLNAAKFG